MNPSRLLPDLQCSLLAEDVRQEVHGGFVLVGVLGFIRVPQVPVTAHKLCVFNRWTSGLGQFTETVRFMAPDQTTVLRTGHTRFVLQAAAHHATNLTVLGQLQFPVAGIYHVEILVDEVMKIRYPLPVVVVPPGPPRSASGGQPTSDQKSSESPADPDRPDAS
jgi:hypothetical protein